MIDDSECRRYAELCVARLSAAQAREIEDEKFRFHLGAAERHLARAEGALGVPKTTHQRRVRLGQAALSACSEALEALRDGASFHECRRLVRAAERCVSRFQQTGEQEKEQGRSG